MKYLLFAVIVGAVGLLGTPAMAHVVQATSSLSLTDVDINDKPQLEQALKDAVGQMLKTTIAFEPTFVALTDAQVIGERLYFRVLIADEDGERTLAELNRDGLPEDQRPARVRMTL